MDDTYNEFSENFVDLMKMIKISQPRKFMYVYSTYVYIYMYVHKLPVLMYKMCLYS